MVKNLQEMDVGYTSSLQEWTVGEDVIEVQDGPDKNWIPPVSLRVCFAFELRALRFVGSEQFLSLRSIYMAICSATDHIAGLELLPYLEELVISRCPLWVLIPKSIDQLDTEDELDMEEEKEEESITSNTYFPSLKMLSLSHLRSLKAISSCPLTFPCLETLKVIRCPRLRRLPLGPHSAMNMREIVGSGGWWCQLKWEDEATKLAFISCFVEIDAADSDMHH